jgi:soluble epoxide hydrolase/lipid-phosphate phosphatase
MDSSQYKQLTTSTGQTYNYYFSAAQAPKPTLLLVHGFPSTSYDWRHQVAYFQARGYGIIVPDQLGYGGTSKPADTKSYRPSSMAKSLVEILDAEGVEKAVAIGHDWCVYHPPVGLKPVAQLTILLCRGSFLTSRLASYYPERFLAFGFLSVGYISPEGTNLQAVMNHTKKTLGYEIFGYFLFFSEEGADAIIETHVCT